MSFLEVTVNRETSSVPQDGADSGGCPAGGFGRRSVLQGVAAAGLAGVGGNLLGRGNLVGRGAHPNGVAVETAAAGSEFPFYGARISRASIPIRLQSGNRCEGRQNRVMTVHQADPDANTECTHSKGST